MRHYIVALVLVLATSLAAVAYFASEWRALQAFCQGLEPGPSIAQVRESARAQGFRATVLPGTQLSVEPARWFHSPAPQCLAVFHPSTQVLEHRFWQGR